MPARSVSLVATLGTNDLAYQLQSGEWVSLGNNEADEDGLGPLQQALIDLGYDSEAYLKNFRGLTQRLIEDGYRIGNQLMASKLGRLIEDLQSSLRQVVLIATDQAESQRLRNSDTLHVAELIRLWIADLNPGISVTVLTVGPGGEQPRDFDGLMRLWQCTFREQLTLQPGEQLWLALQGGIAPMRESLRIAALNQFGDLTASVAFEENTEEQARGEAARYRPPQPGQYYLWELIRRQALTLVKACNYSAARALLDPYLQGESCGRLQILLKAGEEWNRARFSTSLQLLQSLPGLGSDGQRRHQEFWRYSYESLHLARVRVEQGNLVEAMLHSFRGMEDTLTRMICHHYREHISEQANQFPMASEQIVRAFASPHRQLRERILELQESNQGLEVKGWLLRWLACSHIRGLDEQPGWQAFWSSAMQVRNNQAHRVLGLDERAFFEAWSTWDDPVSRLEDWDRMLTRALNCLTGQRFRSSSEASLFRRAHLLLEQELQDYLPS